MYLQLFFIYLISHFNVTVIIRMIQGARPFRISTDKIHPLETPKLLMRYRYMRLLFILLASFNSYYAPLNILYLFYWLFAVCWWEEFYNLRFKRAILASSLAAKVSVALIIIYGNLCYIPIVLWGVYITYLSTWFEWGLET
jgi:hypothetical protein